MASSAIESVTPTYRVDETSSRQRRDGPPLWTLIKFLRCRAFPDDHLAASRDFNDFISRYELKTFVEISTSKRHPSGRPGVPVRHADCLALKSGRYGEPSAKCAIPGPANRSVHE